MITVFIESFPVIILTLISTLRLAKDRNKQKIFYIFLLPVIVAGLWNFIRSISNTGLASLLVLTLLELCSFEVFHVRHHKMTVFYHGLFYLAVFIIALNGLLFTDGETTREIINGSKAFVNGVVSGTVRESAARNVGMTVNAIVSEYILLLLWLLTESNSRYLKSSYEESVISYQNQLLTRQVNEVQNTYMIMRGWRHDYHNHLQTLKAHLKLKQNEEAGKYLDRLENDLDDINYLIESGNVNLDAILNSKLSLALKENITIHCKAEVPNILVVSELDLCVLIGNLIDNAVEACQKMTESNDKRFIRLYIGTLKKQLYISVTNGTEEAERKIDEDYISTKRGNHGHGLKRINNIVEKYEGYINRKNEPGVFVTEIMLPL